MWKSFWTIAVRNLTKRKSYAVLNILGLAIGMACCLLLFQYVAYEKSYDNISPLADRIYRVRLDSWQEGKLAWQAATSYPITGPNLKKDYPEIEDFCRLHDAELLLSNDAQQVKFAETKGYHADPSAIKLFGLQLLEGNAADALTGPDKILLSESMAKKYFSTQNAIGKILTVRNTGNLQHYQVTGVFKDYPGNSHLTIDYLVSYATLSKIWRANGDTTNAPETLWGWYDFYTYVLLKPGTDAKALEKKMPDFCWRYYPDLNWAKMNKAHDEIHFIPLRDIHLYSNYYQEAELNGNGRAVSFLFMIAFFIIAIAWINYINLATARSVERAKEVGVRKVMGALRNSLIKQFLLESFILNFTSLLLAIIIVLISSGAFNRLTGHAHQNLFTIPANYLLLFFAIFITGTFLSGIYPAFVLSGYQPVAVLKGAFKNTAGGLLLRKTLMIVQFATSVILIAGTMIVYQQVQFMRSKNPGFNLQQTLVINGANAITDSVQKNLFEPFKNELMQLPGVKNITASSGVMGKEIYWSNDVKRWGANGTSDKTFTLYHFGFDYEFVPAYNIKLRAGRNFSKQFGTDHHSAILNETAVKLFGFANAAAAINQKIVDAGKDTLNIIGVLADFHHLGLQKTIEPQLFLLKENAREYYSVKIASSNMHQSVASVNKIWNKYFPDDPFNYFFLDDFYNKQYHSESTFGNVFALFASLAILIACFGLLGLSAYNILQRTREIGIRKVLGASVAEMLYLLSKDFIKLVLIAFVLAVPITWWVMYNWLQDFAYRIAIGWWVFAIAGLTALLVAIITVSFQSVKAATMNPIDSLRTE
jgi:putative ABC transport system permease protein